MTCSCGNLVYIQKRGLCRSCYQKWWKAEQRRLYGQSYETTRMERIRGPRPPCPVCGGKPKYKGYCDNHRAECRSPGCKNRVSFRPGRCSDCRTPSAMPSRVPTWLVDSSGYVYRRYKTADGSKRHEFQHRVVMAEIIGRELLQTETVHHKNGVRTDNRPENLELWSIQQPSGQRVEDKVAWAREILATYGHLFPEK